MEQAFDQNKPKWHPLKRARWVAQRATRRGGNGHWLLRRAASHNPLTILPRQTTVRRPPEGQPWSGAGGELAFKWTSVATVTTTGPRLQ